MEMWMIDLFVTLSLSKALLKEQCDEKIYTSYMNAHCPGQNVNSGVEIGPLGANTLMSWNSGEWNVSKQNLSFIYNFKLKLLLWWHPIAWGSSVMVTWVISNMCSFRFLTWYSEISLQNPWTKYGSVCLLVFKWYCLLFQHMLFSIICLFLCCL